MDINKNYNFSDNGQQISIFVSIGERLRQARKAVGLTQESVADCLCLKLSIIKNIEDGCYNIHKLKIASIFLYGYIRSYARLVHIDDIETDFLNQRFDEMSCAVNTSKKFRVLDLYRQYRILVVFGFVCCVLFVFCIFMVKWYSQNGFSQTNYFGIANLRSIQSFVISEYNQPYLTQQFARSFSLDKNCHISFISSLYCIDNIASPLSWFFCDFKNIKSFSLGIDSYSTKYNVMNDINNVTYSNSLYKHILVLSFTSECWVEVVDANDKILFVGTKYSGDVINLEGQIPYRLVIGSPRSISIRYQGNFVNLDEFVHPHRVTRLTIPM
ncbi:RodZ domain-containing protein [Blochmannia endosymbiont of Polyrhachis (Hedomyrma) turneri]|uniref:RodZ domain-containing protein n=1 Tax=Blochmannia endosymbiont of Polyrhachis (Hedomyrma) turneri TaxID=1505596 RepID=UPI00061A5690|nr:RodZ domain-containing protein [Blochmannia endosymbiont of Polyrhachis (Hedomyrma) turneri]AKC60092.1 cytoskeleton protein rodZ [Blochmannia endosymbiont of Polyrhachis (Hedomyrma) turneri]